MRESFFKIEYYVKINNKMIDDSYILNLRGETIFSIHFWSL
jgi:hypothetical protein